MNIDNLTIGQCKEISRLIGQQATPSLASAIDDFAIGQQVIIRTYSAGVWFGKLTRKAGKEVILEDARRMWKWWAAESISLSAVALHGIKQDKSKIAEVIPSVWIEAIEIIPCSQTAIESIGGCPHATAE